MKTVMRPDNMMKSIDAIWIVLGKDPKTGLEGIAAKWEPGRGICVLVEANEEKLEVIFKEAAQAAMLGGTEMRVVKFTNPETLAVYRK